MKRAVLAGMAAVLVLAGCATIRESRFNPFNWFGQSRAAERIALPAEQADVRALAPEVLTMTVEAYPGGAIVKATARTPDQGWWDAELVARPVDADGVLVYDFRIFPPITDTPVGPAQSREVTAAAAISDVRLANVTQIVVQGEGNARASRR